MDTDTLHYVDRRTGVNYPKTVHSNAGQIDLDRPEPVPDSALKLIAYHFHEAIDAVTRQTKDDINAPIYQSFNENIGSIQLAGSIINPVEPKQHRRRTVSRRGKSCRKTPR